MAQQEAGKPETGYIATPTPKGKEHHVLLLLRLLAFMATASATIVMAVNKESKTLVVATIGNKPVNATLTAKFQDTPAFLFFVIANGMASLHSWAMITAEVFGQKIDYKGLRLATIAILDMLIVGLAAAGDGAATFMAELGKNGNSHARWNKICDKFGTYCDHGSGALIASLVGLLILLIIGAMSIIKLHKATATNDVEV